MKKIELTRGKVALVDDSDYKQLIKHKWYAHFDGTEWYAVRNVWIETPTRRRTTIKMHRYILGLQSGDGLVIDHINGDGLDNRRCNLRLATHAENLRNQRTQIKSKSGLKGVTASGGKWRVSIKINGRTKHVGIFDDPKDAGLAYDKAALSAYGEFARLNFPDSTEDN